MHIYKKLFGLRTQLLKVTKGNLVCSLSICKGHHVHESSKFIMIHENIFQNQLTKNDISILL